MYLIVGLGNPEGEYSKTRHNMGFDVINKLAKKYDISINKSNFDIRITKTDVIWDNENKRGSNIREMFEIIDW